MIDKAADWIFVVAVVLSMGFASALPF